MTKTVMEDDLPVRQRFVVNTPGTLRVCIYRNNRRIVPQSATLTVYRPESDERLIDGAVMTVEQDGVLEYSLSKDDNSTPGAGYMAVVEYVYESVTRYLTIFYDVVRSRPAKVITDEDVVDELPQLKEKGWRIRGRAEGGSTTTIVDSDLRRYPEDYFTGGLAHSVDKDETREIVDFDPSTGTVTTQAFSSAITTDNYILVRSFSREIQRAFEKVEDGLRRLGRRPELVLDPHDLREVHIYFAVSEVCKGLVADERGVWWEMWKEYERKAQECLRTMVLKYDANNDGYINIGEGRERIKTPTMRTGRR